MGRSNEVEQDGTERDRDRSPRPSANPNAGLAREVGDLDDPDAEQDDDALPGRMGGGLAGG